MSLTGYLSFGDWEATFGGNATPTSTMLDRPLLHAHAIQIRGERGTSSSLHPLKS